MTAPEDRIYCGDSWCDGDHIFHGERCSDDRGLVDYIDELY